MFTPRQRDLMKFIEDYIIENGLSPTYAEMMVGIDVKSKASIHRLVSGLEKRGYLLRWKGFARGLMLLSPPGRDIVLTEDTARLVNNHAKLTNMSSNKVVDDALSLYFGGR